MQASWVERSEGGVKIEVVEGTIRATGDMTFIVAEDENQKGLFLWTRVKKEDNYLIMWSPNVEQFKTLVRDGKWNCNNTSKSAYR